MHDDSIPTLASSYRFQWEKAQNCYVLLYPEGMVKLNPSAAEILKHCDGTQTVRAIIAALQQRYPDADLEGDVHEFLEVAHGNGWID
ncbi:pyrroloquinoline quinone biosynthesis peptide chaperone PqqD [Nitrosococcus wardiae]|uniref:Pyrroloquinoline quinone biosynthesis peptide chaperone PqqD n=1 Tax=Nitrosococcus wardiae TaxID=1814290 RepID=A0A4P7BYA7_9GAMM|nr:pyrroloquinoline quinone biosynthesis peptide chaperone PqqD [Nitrosococcus wardiae]QBQ54219.1 pyrroloquinoline quinone biosynthesis peptide chaperone PqqD [Nitrosococcus wardiae]